MNKQRRAALAKALPLIEQAQALLAQAAEIAQGVRDDEQEVYDNMSEGQQNGEAGDAMQTAISSMEEAVDGIAGLDLKSIADAISEAADMGAEVKAPTLSEADAEKRRMARLPEWAKRRIAEAERLTAEADARLASSFGEPDPEDPTEMVLDDYMSPHRGRSLPCRQVMFPALGIRVMVNKRGDKPMLEIQAVSIGMLNILPQASNTILISTQRF